MRREYKTLSKDDADIVRVHHDNDKSFEGVCADAWRKDKIINTNTGGYNPQANSRVERRHGSIKELFKACMFMATGGLPYYYALRGPGQGLGIGTSIGNQKKKSLKITESSFCPIK